jgi:hypothetical protein
MGADDAIRRYHRERRLRIPRRRPQVMRRLWRLRTGSVAVGAHPGLPDLVGFGRRKMDITPD